MTKETLPFIPVPFMTVIPGRKPEQKVHKRLTDAKSAFGTPKYNPFFRVVGGKKYGYGTTHGWGQLYEFKDGEWHLHTEVPKPSDEHAIEKYPYRETRPWRLSK